MSLNFLNDLRFFDSRRRQIRFTGHDGLRVIPFRIDVDAIKTRDSGQPDGEDGYLSSFDGNLEAIHTVARRAYGNGLRSVYVLSAEDFS